MIGTVLLAVSLAACQDAAPEAERRILFGGNDALTRLPGVGGAVAIVRTYHRLGASSSGFPSQDESAALDSGATLLTSIAPGPGRSIPGQGALPLSRHDQLTTISSVDPG